MSAWTGQVNKCPIDVAASRFGLETVRRGNDVSFICPICFKSRRHSKGSDKRKSAKVMPDNGWWCEPCETTGDVVGLVSGVLTGKTRFTKETHKQVRAACAAHGLCDPDSETETPLMTPRVWDAPPPVKTIELSYPCSDMLRDFWIECEKPKLDTPAGDYLVSRGFDLHLLDWAFAGSAVRVAVENPGEFATNWNASNYPLVFPLYDWRGVLRSVQGRAIDMREPRSVFPKGHKVGGLVFADAFGLTFLQSKDFGGLQAIVIVEGATDTLKVSQCLEASGETVGVFGYIAGSKSVIEAIRWPKGIPVLVATDNDATGDKYAKEITEAIAGRTTTLRVKAKAGDWCDMESTECIEVFKQALAVL